MSLLQNGVTLALLAAGASVLAGATRDGSMARRRTSGDDTPPPSQEEIHENAAIGWRREGGYTLSIAGRHVATGDMDAILKACRAWCKDHGWRPALYEVNDHGNVSELNWYGKYRRGWV